jgi:hypothetical protein
VVAVVILEGRETGLEQRQTALPHPRLQTDGVGLPGDLEEQRGPAAHPLPAALAAEDLPLQESDAHIGAQS